jgi:hypothetical protein
VGSVWTFGGGVPREEEAQENVSGRVAERAFKYSHTSHTHRHTDRHTDRQPKEKEMKMSQVEHVSLKR